MTQKKGRYRGGQGGLAWSCPRDWAGRGSVLPGFPAKDEKKKSPPVAEAPENSKNKSTGPSAPVDQPLTSLPPCGMSFLWLL